MDTSCNLSQKYVIPIPTLTWKFVWLSFKQLACVAGSIIFGIQTRVASKVSNTNSYVKNVWAYFKQLVLIFPALVFAYELQSVSKLLNNISYVNLEICMAILQTASLCCWKHHFWHTTWLPLKVSYLHSYIQSQICMTIFETDTFDISSTSCCIWIVIAPNVSNTDSYVNLGICMTILQTASLCC